MNTQPQIDVWISAEGAITIHAVGYVGSTCEEATAFLESELGTVGHKQRSRDWYRRAPNQNQNKNQNTNQQKQQS